MEVHSDSTLSLLCGQQLHITMFYELCVRKALKEESFMMASLEKKQLKAHYCYPLFHNLWVEHISNLLLNTSILWWNTIFLQP